MTIRTAETWRSFKEEGPGESNRLSQLRVT
jgi:hypothetical protein